MNRSFWTRGLLYKEWRQQRIVLLFIVLAVFFQPILGSIAGEILNMMRQFESVQPYPALPALGEWARAVLLFYGSNQLSFLPVGATLFWGVFMMDSERRGQNLEALLAGPVSRRSVISTKWGLGIATILLLNLPGAIVLSVEALGAPGTHAIWALGWATRWYFVQTGLECLTFSVGLIVGIGVGTYALAIGYAIVAVWLPYLIVSTIAATIQLAPHVYTSSQGMEMSFYNSALPQALQQLQTILNPYTYMGHAYYSVVSLSPEEVPLSFSLVFPVCLVLAIALFWGAFELFGRLSVESWRKMFTMRGFKLALLLLVGATLAWIVGFVAMGRAENAIVMNNYLLHQHPSLIVTKVWTVFVIGFIVFLAVEWLLWMGIRQLVRRRARSTAIA